MKTLHIITLSFLLMILSDTVSFAQPDTTNRARRADSLTTFFIGGWGGGDLGHDGHADRFGNRSMPDSEYRYTNLDDTLGLNAEDRGVDDIPSGRPAPKDSTLGGKNAPHLDVLILDPHDLIGAFTSAQYIRFEFERHQKQDETTEYAGFLHRSGLTGRNVIASGATLPAWLAETSRATDTNAIELNGSDSSGVFADSLWFPGFLGSQRGIGYFRDCLNRKMLLRIRVKVTNDSVDNAHPPIVFTCTRTERDSTSVILTHTDTIRADAAFTHIGTDFDIIDIRFSRMAATDSISFSFYWPKEVNAIFDYMEFMTAHIDSSDHDFDMWDSKAIDEGAWSAEDFLASDPVELNKLIHSIKDSFLGRINYLQVGDEFSLAYAKPLKRLIKLMRDSTGGKIEISTNSNDSTNALTWIANGLPNNHDFAFEGRRRGWVDTNFADPKMLSFDPYRFEGWFLPLPKRVPSRDTTAIKTWEDTFLPTIDKCNDVQVKQAQAHYTPEYYSFLTQNVTFPQYLRANRQLRRWQERQNNNSHFKIFNQAGAAVNLLKDHLGQPFLAFNGFRPPTGPEMKVTCNLTASLGGVGIILYALANYPPGSSGVSDGGIMASNGVHDSMYYTTFSNVLSDTATGRVWMGFHERYDTIRALIPKLIKYGTTLLKAKYVGDWLASELLLADSATKAKLPFLDTSIRTQDDSMRRDAYKPTLNLTDTVFFQTKICRTEHIVADTSNRTFVHISMWLDTNQVAKDNHSDTLLYITNMRTDDSYDTSEVPSTLDRRLITMRFKAKHLVQDILDTNGYLALDDRRIWTPYVGAGDSLRILLLPGDGILVRLLPPESDTMKQMRVAINFPKGTKEFNDYGRINFDKPVKGVKDPTTASKYNVPSTRYSYVGIKDADTVKLWQDSLTYIKIDSVDNTRKGYWRNQNWTSLSTPATTTFNFKQNLLPSDTRKPQISTDSLAHKIIIKNDMEGLHFGGKVGIRDPFLVDSATLTNVYDTLYKLSPFTPHVLSAGRMPGADSDHYGGIFLKQNKNHDPSIPIYTLQATSVLKLNTYRNVDTIPTQGDWVFIQWAATDSIVADDAAPWLSKDDQSSYEIWTPNKSTEVVFGKDSSIYAARYKAHMAAFNSDVDSGLSWNNQRKLYYIKTVSGKRWYRIVYASNGRIFTATGYRTDTTNNGIFWNNEQLVSDWDDPHARYPSLSGHTSLGDTNFYYLYQTDVGDHTNIILSRLDTNGVPELEILNDTNAESEYQDAGVSDATPVISSITARDGKRIDVMAWTSQVGIIVEGLYDWYDTTDETGTTYLLFSDSTKHPRHPTIWVDTCYSSIGDTITKYQVTLAWEQDTTMNFGGESRNHFLQVKDSTYRDVYVVRFDLIKKPKVVDTIWHIDTVGIYFEGHWDIWEINVSYTLDIPDYFYFEPNPSESGYHPKNLSWDLNHHSYDNRNPCISGARLDSTHSQVRIAYESSRYDSGWVSQGVNVAGKLSGATWSNTNFFQASLVFGNSFTDKYLKPSIEVSRYHDSLGTYLKRSNYYSLAHEKGITGRDTKHWGMDNATQRLAPTVFSNISNPQLAVVRESIDSCTYRMGKSIENTGNPHMLMSGYTSLYKLGGIDTLWQYSTIEEPDSARTFYIQHGVGEYAVDDGSNRTDLEIEIRSDSEEIDNLHQAEYFTQSENFTLPASGTFSYFRWISPTDAALFAEEFDTITYALDFFDTSGAFVCRLDSLTLSDSVTAIARASASILLDRESDTYGYVRFRRISSGLASDSGKVEPIISSERLSEPMYKRIKGNSFKADEIEFTAEPNPAKGDVTLTFTIPVEGSISLNAYDQLGLQVTEIAVSREFHSGIHKLVWHPQGLPSGMYYLHLNYGNLQKVVRVVYIQ